MASNPHCDHGLLWRAIAISLLLHALLLLQPAPGIKAPHPSAEPSLMAWLRPRVNPPSPEFATPAPASHEVSAPPIAREVSASALPVTPPVMPASQNETEVPDSPATGVNASGKNIVAAAVTSTGNIEAEFDEALKTYMSALAVETGRVKKYPRRALTAGWTGVAEIRVRATVGGNVQAPQLHKSSGYADIDNAALSFVGIALKRTPLPASLRGRNFGFLLPVSFTINDE